MVRAVIMASPPRPARVPPAGGDDEALLRAASGPDEQQAAFLDLYRRHRAGLLSFLVRYLRDATLAEDVLQETFVRVHAHLDAAPPCSFRAWVHRVARNVATDLLRREGKQERLAASPAAPVPAPAPGPDAEAASREAIDRARAALATLPDEERALLLQRHASGLTLDELAAAWDCTERTVRNRLEKASQALARALVEGGRP